MFKNTVLHNLSSTEAYVSQKIEQDGKPRVGFEPATNGDVTANATCAFGG